MTKFIIKGELPSLNEYIAAINSNRHKGNAMKQDTQEAIGWQIRQQCPIRRQITRPVTIRFIWACKNAKKDIDNVAFAKKFILDALVNMKILQNDTRQWIKGFSDEFVIDKVNPRVEVILTEVE